MRTTPVVTAGELQVRLSPAEKIAALRGDLHIPLSAITSVQVVPDALGAVHGMRAPGLSWPGVHKVGTWRTGHGSEFVSARRGQAAVRVTLSGHRLSSLLLGTDDPEALAEQIRGGR